MEMYGKDIRVEIIPPTKISVRNPDRTENGKKLRVAAYCRVSTGDEQQQSSYTQQKEYYTWLIGTNKDWEFAAFMPTRVSREHLQKTGLSSTVS